MDPDQALQDGRRAAASVLQAVDGNGDLIESAERLAEAFQALDGWLASGGFKPQAWA